MQRFFEYLHWNELRFEAAEEPNENKTKIFFLEASFTSFRMTSRSSCKRSTNFDTPIGPLSRIISCNTFVQFVKRTVRNLIAERRRLKSVS